MKKQINKINLRITEKILPPPPGSHGFPGPFKGLVVDVVPSPNGRAAPLVKRKGKPSGAPPTRLFTGVVFSYFVLLCFYIFLNFLGAARSSEKSTQTSLNRECNKSSKILPN